MAKFDETYDWVVVGSGAGACISALVMQQAGKSVVILEKSPFFGGTTAKSGGVMWIPNNRFMHEDGEPDSIEAAMTYLDALQELDGGDAPGTSQEKRRAYFANAPKAIDFLCEQGVALRRGPAFWPDYYDELPGACKTSRTVVALPFNLKELGEYSDKIRPGFAPFNALLEEGMQAGHARTNPRAKKIMGRIALRTIRDKLLGRKYTTAGAALQGRLLKAALDAGIEIRLQAPVEELLIEGGNAAGVVTSTEGQRKRIGARLGVLVNAGGFAHNQAMRDKYAPGTRVEWTQAADCDTGEMIEELDRVGGKLAQMDQMVGYQSTLSPGWEQAYVAPGAQGMTGKPHAILVDQSGERFMNEGGSYELYCETMRKRNQSVPAIPSWAIFDRQYVEKYKVADKYIDKTIPDGWIEAGYLHKADTLEELADSIKIDPAKLSAMVSRWNGFVQAGEDKDFHRGEREYDNCGFVGDPFSDARSRGTIERGPFYAVPVIPGDVSTYGGVVTDSNGQVVGENGTPIGRLYATGTSSASVMGNVYAGAGSSIGPSLTFGYIAARHAAGLNSDHGGQND
ncbi:FAD-dependent oxidoreductase [Erythrobacter alti]|uniref:FAD-dependent oxidoreductase n=1 Tax=Erythrobacter alti TaxID=1896145 RepID=UPI0030F38CD5